MAGSWSRWLSAGRARRNRGRSGCEGACLHARRARKRASRRSRTRVAGLPPASPPFRLRFSSTRSLTTTSRRGKGWPTTACAQAARRLVRRPTYEGIILSFFKSVADARASLKTLAGCTEAGSSGTSSSRGPESGAEAACARPCRLPASGWSGSAPREAADAAGESLATSRADGEGTPAGCRSPRRAGPGSADDGCCTRV